MGALTFLCVRNVFVSKEVASGGVDEMIIRGNILLAHFTESFLLHVWGVLLSRFLYIQGLGFLFCSLLELFSHICIYLLTQDGPS